MCHKFEGFLYIKSQSKRDIDLTQHNLQSIHRDHFRTLSYFSSSFTMTVDDSKNIVFFYSNTCHFKYMLLIQLHLFVFTQFLSPTKCREQQLHSHLFYMYEHFVSFQFMYEVQKIYRNVCLLLSLNIHLIHLNKYRIEFDTAILLSIGDR